MNNIGKDAALFLKDRVGRSKSESYIHKLNKSNSACGLINPMIIEDRPMNVTSIDIFSRLMMDRILFLGSPIDDDVANIIIAQLLWLNATAPKKSDKNKSEINMYINSPGGYVYSGLGIIDTMRLVGCDIKTTAVGLNASMAAVILSAGTPGKRYALSNSTIMIHQPSSGAEGMVSDIMISANESLRLKNVLSKILADNTKQPLENILKDSDRDYYMTASEAKTYGLIDKVI